MKKPLDQFLDYLQYERMYSPHTILAYKKDVSDFMVLGIDVYGKEDFFADVDRAFFRRWLANINLEIIGKATVGRKISAVKSFYRFLNEKGIVDNKAYELILAPKQEKKLARFLSEEQVEKILENANKQTYSGIRDRAILELLYSCGVRLNELLKIKTTDIQFNKKTIKITGKGSKDRVVPIGETALKAIEKYLKYRQDLLDKLALEKVSKRLFLTKRGAPVYSMMVQRMVREHLFSCAGIFKLNPHIFRHSFATHLLDNGADIRAVKDLLGHESLATTQMYTHLSTKKLKDAYKFAHPRSEEGED